QLLLERVSAADDRGLAALREVSLNVRGGEIFGIAGVDGNGQDELFDVLTGLRPTSAGRIAIGGAEVRRPTPAAMIDAGVACVPPDRQRQGVVPAMSVQENAVLNARLLHACAGRWLTDPAAQRAAASGMVDAYAIKVGALDAPVRGLSGGNLQKLIVARALATTPRVLVAANPTRGLDIAAARAVYAALDAALARGAAVLLIASDLDEIVARCDHLAVLYRGRLSSTLERPFPTDRLAALMAGSDGR
ncbi:MAG: ATP-binding cassette domain-containing protein, partial [Candidatus Binatia bacterium]